MNCTDQVSAPPAARLDESTAAVLVAVAKHFRTVNPADAVEDMSLLVCVSTAAYDFAGRTLGSDDKRIARAALAVLPEPFDGITRGEYVLHIRGAVIAGGHDWPDGDNDPAIPRITGIPAPRVEPIPAKVPVQPGPEHSSAPTCCGRAMRRDGSQWVCGKCRGWNDTGRTALTLVPALTEGAR